MAEQNPDAGREVNPAETGIGDAVGAGVDHPALDLQAAQAAEEASVPVPVANSAKMVYLKDYQPLEYEGGHVHLVYKIISDTRVEVEAVVTMRRKEGLSETNIQPLVLNRGPELKDIQSLNVNGQEVPAAQLGVPDSDIVLPGINGEITMTIRTVLNPKENASKSGLYKSGEMLVTQLESMGFRNIIPFIDRPDISFTWSTEMTADKHQYGNLIATGNEVSDEDNADGTHTAKTESNVRMPDYIYAALAGNFACLESEVTVDGDTIKLEIYAEPETIERTKIAMWALQEALKFDHEKSDRKYPLQKFKLVATLHFNFGAMENFGLNIFNAANILGNSSVTLDDVMVNIAITVGHEAFHTWRGDIVTLENWFETALKEGFVTHTENKFRARVLGDDLAKIEVVRKLRENQFAEDASATAHPILHEKYVGDPMNGHNYSSTTYLKGGQIFGMMETLLGEEAYRAAANLYFERYEGKSASFSKFIECFEESSGVDLTQFRDWLTQVGTPVCDAEGTYNEATQTFSLKVKQKCPKEPFHVLHFPMNIGLVGPDGQDIPLELADGADGHDLNRGILNIRKEEETFVFNGVPKGTVPSLLRGFSAPVTLNYNYSSADLLHLMKNDTDGFNRYEAGQRVAKNELENLLQQRAEGRPMEVSEETFAAYENVLNNLMETDPALAAEILVLPSESEIVRGMEIYDFEAAKAVRQYLRTEIATRFRDRLLELYRQYTDVAATEEGRPDALPLNMDAIKARKAKNVCMEYLGAINGPEELALVKNQFETATTMSDEYAALNLLAAIPEERDAALQKFYQKYKNETLVINKFFKAVSLIDDKDTIRRVKELMAGDDFKEPTPSRVKDLLTFGFAKNFTRMHDISGEGYVLAVDTALSQKNEHVVSTIIKAYFSDLPKMDEVRKGLMTEQLRRLLADTRTMKGPANIAKEILGDPIDENS